MPFRPPASVARRFAAQVRRLAHLCVGVPAYEAYRAHRARAHPGEPVMTYAEFFDNRLRARYARGSQRCC